MQHAMDQELDRIFRLMALLLPHVGLHDAYVGLRSSDELVRANSLELLDNVLDPELRQLLVPLLDSQVSTDERIAMANRLVGAPLDSAEQAVVDAAVERGSVAAVERDLRRRRAAAASP